MMQLPSEELLSEVLEIEGASAHKIEDDNVWFEYEQEMNTYTCWTNQCINIYELAHKCKELAYDKGYMVDSYAYKVKIISPKYEFEHIHTINGDPKTTKPYDIWRDIEACQWILENKDKNVNTTR